jgi:hypothetical protein
MWRLVGCVCVGSADVYVQWGLPTATKVGVVSKGAIFGEVELLQHLDGGSVPIRRRTIQASKPMELVCTYFWIAWNHSVVWH